MVFGNVRVFVPRFESYASRVLSHFVVRTYWSMRCNRTGFSEALLSDNLLTFVDKPLDIICATERWVRQLWQSDKHQKFSRQDNRMAICFLFLAELLQGISGHTYNDCNTSSLPLYTDLHTAIKHPLLIPPTPQEVPGHHTFPPQHIPQLMEQQKRSISFCKPNTGLQWLADCLTTKGLKMTILCGFLLSRTVGRLNCMMWF